MSRLSRLLGLDYLNERRTLSGKPLRVRTAQPSVLFFSVHKAASSFAAGCLRKLTGAAGYKPVDLENYSFQHHRRRPDIHLDYIQATGVFYGPFRKYFPCHEPSLKIIVQVRDPRDAVVSSYFSYRDSHRAPVHEERRKSFAANRAKLNTLTLDQYAALPDSPIAATLTEYATHFFPDTEILILHYEDMVSDFSSWLDSIVEYTGIENSSRVRKLVAKMKHTNSFTQPAEDANSHRRQVRPGEHRRKLSDTSIEKLNRQCRPYFDRMVKSGRTPSRYEIPGIFCTAPDADQANASKPA